MTEFSPQRILFPIDLSGASAHVLRWARLFAERFEAKVELLHAEWFEWPRYFTLPQLEALKAQGREQQTTARGELAELAAKELGPEVEYEVFVAEGHPVPAILSHAAQHRPDLLVMGSHGRSGLERLRLGSVAENVVRSAPCPTLVVKSLEAQAAPPKLGRVLCPVSFTDLSRQCLEVSASLASAFGAELYVAHALEDPGAEAERAQQQLCDWVPAEARGRCHLSEVVRYGNAAEQIVLLARAQAVDLTVIGARHRPFLEFSLLGATTELVVRHSPSAVLVLPQSSSSKS